MSEPPKAPSPSPTAKGETYGGVTRPDGPPVAASQEQQPSQAAAPASMGYEYGAAPPAKADQEATVVTDRSRTRPAESESPLAAQQRILGKNAGEVQQGVPFTGHSSLPAGRLVIVGANDEEGPSFPLIGDQIDIGRSEGTVVLGDDRYMSPRHARLVRVDGKWFIRDLQSTNGVFVRIRQPHELKDGDMLLLGVEVLRFELLSKAELGLGPAVEHGTLIFGSPPLPRFARLVQRTVEGVARDVYHLHRLETIIGRESGDIVFPDDPYMSRRHAAIRRSTTSGSLKLVDLDSSNGTFVAIREDCPLSDGDSIRIGQHLFRVELASG